MRDNDLPSLEKLGEKIDSKRKAPPIPEDVTNKGAGVALRLASEMVAGILVGLIVGHYLDKWLGTSPVLFLICMALGLAAGFMTMMRSVKAMNDSEKDSDESNH